MAKETKTDSLANILRDEIQKGVYGTSGSGYIPPVDELIRRWKTTRTTVQQVLMTLRAEGIIRPKGTRLIVNQTVLRLPGLTPTFESYLREQGFKPKMENLISPAIEAMPKEIAELFGQPEGVKVVHRMRRQDADDLSLRIAENWYPAELAGEFVEEMRKDDHMDVLSAIKKAHKVSIENVHEDIIARIPTPQEAEWLDLARYQPVIEIRRSNFTSDGRPVMFNRLILVAPHFVLTRDYTVDHWK